MDNGKMPEEFNNFMHKVTEVDKIVRKLSSSDKKQQAIGILEADRYLNDGKERIIENINEEDVELVVKTNKTVINKSALTENDTQDSATISQESFMKEVSKDVEQRYKDKCIRTEKMETFKMQATKAFRRGEYEKALSCYNKAIEQIRDSPLLFNNRCLTYINLKFYKFAIDDAKMAIKLNENCLRSYLLLAKAYFLNNDEINYDMTIKQAKEISPIDFDLIDDFQKKLKKTAKDEDEVKGHKTVIVIPDNIGVDEFSYSEESSSTSDEQN